MTGEMFKPPNADKEWDWWKKHHPSALGDDALCIRPNYPEMFGLQDMLREMGFEAAEVLPFDTYQGAFVELEGIEVKDEEGYYASGYRTQQMSRALGSCKVWRTGVEEYYVDCGHNNEEFFGEENGLEIGNGLGGVLGALNELKESGKLVPQKHAMKMKHIYGYGRRS